MALVDKLLTATIRYLQKKQKSLRKDIKRKKAGQRKAKAKKAKSALRGRSKPPAKKPHAPILKKKPNGKLPQETALGLVTHYFSRIEVVVIKLNKAGLKVGETIRIKGKATDFIQKVKSLQIESVDVASAKKGALVGLKVARPAKAGDKVTLIG